MKTRTWRRKIIALAAALLLVLVPVTLAYAHPLGNFTINHYSRLEIARDEIRLRYVLDYAEIPAFQAKQKMDTNGDGAVDAAEQGAFIHQLERAREKLHLQIDAQPLALELVPDAAQLEFLEGQGGLQVMRFATWYRAVLPASRSRTMQLHFQDNYFAERMGWREIVARAGDGIAIQQSDVPAQDTSNELRAYPETLLTNPLDQRAANVTFAFGSAGTNASEAPETLARGAFAFDRTINEFAALATTKQELTLSVILASLLAAVFLGALHAFEPGHGKAIVGAYLVGARGTAKHALVLGLVVTATHTLGVYALGVVTLFASRYILPEQLYPWLGIISGALVALLGARMFWERIRSGRVKTRAHSHDGQVHAHAHTHPHPHSHDAAHSHPHAHAATNAETEAEHARQHLAPLLKNERLTWRSLFYMGVSGGLLPCPSALVVMLSAIALGRVAFGLILIVAFSLGLAGVLTLSGLIFLYAGQWAGRFMRRGEMQNWFWRLLPMVSALFVTLLGLGIAVESIKLMGGFK